MRNRRYRTARFWFFCGVFLLQGTLLSAQGPLDGYMKGKGVLDIVPSLSFNNAKTFLGADDRRYAVPFRGTMVSLFTEYGLADRFDVVFTGAYLFTAARNGLQDGGVFVKYRPVYADLGKRGHLGIIGGLGATFPLSNYEVVETGALGQKAVTVPARLIVQYETPVGLFINATAGYHWRLDALRAADIETVRRQRPDFQPVEPAPFSTFLLKVGFPAKHFYTDVWIEQQWTNGGNDYAPDVLDLPQGYGIDYTQIGGVFYYSENGRRGFFVSGGHIFRGRNTSKITRVTVGLVQKMGKR